MNYTRTEIGSNIGFTSVVDKKFNSCSLQLMMIVPMGENASDNSVAVNCISDANSKLNSIAAMNERLSELYGAEKAESITIQYGGSMNATNAAELLSKENVDGGLIGGASLKAPDFAAIVKAASEG